MNMPNTIKHPETFLKAGAAGFDGVFDWSWTDGCFNTTITPMDFDGVVERKGNFLLFETKDLGKDIPKGQRLTLESAHRLGCFTIMLIHGKERPEYGEIWFPGVSPDKGGEFTGVEAARDLVARWYAYADKTPRKDNPDLGFLQRQVTQLQAERDGLKGKLANVERQLEQLLAGIRA